VRTEDEISTGAGPLHRAGAIVTLVHALSRAGWLPLRARVEALLLAGTGLALAKECQPMGGHGETTLEQGGGQDLFALTD